MPACASCNINKHAMKLEDFRSLVAGFMKHLNERNTQYKIAKRYGLVIEDQKPVIFYFEQYVPKTNQVEGASDFNAEFSAVASLAAEPKGTYVER